MKLCTLITRPPTTAPQHKKVVSRWNTVQGTTVTMKLDYEISYNMSLQYISLHRLLFLCLLFVFPSLPPPLPASLPLPY